MSNICEKMNRSLYSWRHSEQHALVRRQGPRTIASFTAIVTGSITTTLTIAGLIAIPTAVVATAITTFAVSMLYIRRMESVIKRGVIAAGKSREIQWLSSPLIVGAIGGVVIGVISAQVTKVLEGILAEFIRLPLGGLMFFLSGRENRLLP